MSVEPPYLSLSPLRQFIRFSFSLNSTHFRSSLAHSLALSFYRSLPFAFFRMALTVRLLVTIPCRAIQARAAWVFVAR